MNDLRIEIQKGVDMLSSNHCQLSYNVNGTVSNLKYLCINCDSGKKQEKEDELESWGFKAQEAKWNNLTNYDQEIQTEK